MDDKQKRELEGAARVLCDQNGRRWDKLDESEQQVFYNQAQAVRQNKGGVWFEEKKQLEAVRMIYDLGRKDWVEENYPRYFAEFEAEDRDELEEEAEQ